MVVSVGFAGALDVSLRVGQIFEPRLVIDAGDGSRTDTGGGTGVLVSFSSVAGPEQKARLASSYQANAVDMEAASVARAAQVHNLSFLAVKAISDDVDFELAELNRFIRNGQFETKLFGLYLLLRPWLWSKMIRLARNTRLASHNLCSWLRESALTNTIVPGTPKSTSEGARASKT